MVTSYKTHYPLILRQEGVSPALRDLCAAYGKTTPGVEAPPEDMLDVAAWIRWTQAHFIRPPHLDHQDLKHREPHPYHADFMTYFETLGLTHAVYPPREAYEIAAIHGGTPWDTWERMAHLMAQMKAGLEVKKVLYINGERLLMASEYQDNCYGFPAFLNMERAPITLPDARPLRQNDMALAFWEELKASYPSAPPLTFVTLSVEGGYMATSPKRFNTVDTVRATFDAFRSLRTFLFVSNAPYGPYQDASVRLVVRERGLDNCVVDSMSPALMHEVSTLPYLDTTARLLYTENQIQTYKRSPH